MLNFERIGLIVFENTSEFRKEFEKAQHRLDKILEDLTRQNFRCVFIGNLRFGYLGEFEVWLNAYTFLTSKFISPEEAVKYVKKYGTSGWWTLDELEDFSKGEENIIFKEAMFSLGYLKQDNIWIRQSFCDNENFSLKEECFLKHLEKEKKLNPLFLNEPNVADEYKIQADKNGLIHIFNKESMFDLYSEKRMFADHLCIAKKQDNFMIYGENVCIDKEKFVRLKVEAKNNEYEFFWPSVISKENVYNLKNTFKKKF